MEIGNNDYQLSMGKLDVIESNSQQVFHSVENHDFTFMPSVGTVVVLQFLSKVEDTKCLFISNDTSISSRFPDMPYQTSIYDSRFSVAGSSWLTYDLCVYLISQDHRFLELFDFVVLDDIDSRGAKSDYLLSLIMNLRIKGKFMIPLRSGFDFEVYTSYVEKFGYSSNVLKLIEQPSKNIYYLPSGSNGPDINKEIIKTIERILEIDTSSNAYDILVLLSSYQEIQLFKNQLLDQDIKHDFSLLTDISNYRQVGSHRRIIIANDSKMFNDVDHKIRFIVDSGILEVEKVDQTGLEIFVKKPTNKNQVNQHLAVLQNENSSYFAVFVEDSLNDFEFGVMNNGFMVQLLYLLKIGIRLNEFEFLKAPRQETVRNSITMLIYLGLITLEIDGTVRLTDLGKTVMNFQLEFSNPSLSLFTALSNSEKFQCTEELSKISSVILSTNVNMLSNDINNGHKTAALPTSNFVAIVDIFDSIIENEQHIKQSNSRGGNNVNLNKMHKYRALNNKDTKKQILHCYKRLKDQLNYPIRSSASHAHSDEIHKCLLMGFQIQIGSIVKNVSNQAVHLTIVPIKNPRQLSELDDDIEDHNVQFIIKPSESEIDEYSDNDIIIYHSCKYMKL